MSGVFIEKEEFEWKGHVQTWSHVLLIWSEKMPSFNMQIHVDHHSHDHEIFGNQLIAE